MPPVINADAVSVMESAGAVMACTGVNARSNNREAMGTNNVFINFSDQPIGFISRTK
jgi:hypothetical protein